MSALNISDAVKLLKVYSCIPEKQDNSAATRQQLRNALLMVARESGWENIGICADNLDRGLTALDSYLQALGYSYDFSQQQDRDDDLSEPVYIKFNTQKMSYYVSSYTGDSRGVLIAMQDCDEAIAGTYGYFPLDLFR